MLTNCAKNWTAWTLSCSNRSQRDLQTYVYDYRGSRFHRSPSACMAYGWKNFEN